MIDTEKQTNPVYGILIDQIKTENKLFLAKSDHFNAYLTLLCRACYTDSEYKTLASDYIKSTESKVKEKSDLSILKNIALAKYLLSQTNKRSKAIDNYIEIHEGDFLHSQLSNNTKGLVLFLLGDGLKNYKKVSAEANLRSQDLFKAGNIVGAIDLLVGVNELSQTNIESLTSLKSTSSLNTERLAKLVIILHRASVGYGMYVRALEERLYESATQWRTPDITLSLFEAYKLINSNIPEEHLNTILKNLKKVNTNWAKLISKIEKEGVVVNMEGLQRLPDFSPNDDIWALKALEVSNRSYTYQLTEAAYEEYFTLKTRQAPGYHRVKSSSLIIYFVLLAGLTILNYFLVDKYGWGIKEALQLELPSNADKVSEWFKIVGTILINPTVALLLSLLWVILLFKNCLLKSGQITTKGLLLNFPIVTWITKKG